MASRKQEPDEAEPEVSDKMSSGLLFCVGAAFVLAAIGCCYLGTFGTADARAEAADYHRAPGCTPNGSASSGLPACAFQTMTVTAKNFVDGDEGPDTYKLTLNQSGGSGQEVALVGPEKVDLFNHVTVGGSVQVKSWQGQILILTIPGWHCGTPNHPDAQVASGNKSLFAGGFFVLLGGLTLFYGGRAYKNEKRASDFLHSRSNSATGE